MREFYSLLLAVVLLPLTAQVADKSVTDCNGNTRSIHGVLATGKVLVVASKGLDCSICKSAAPAVQNFAAQNIGTIEVWGAMTYTYSSNTPTCSDVSSWISTYGWTDVFTFVDSDKHWFLVGTPRYIVYDPSDYSIAYAGPNRTTAFQTASGLANSVGLSGALLSDIELVNFTGGVEIRNLSESADYRLVSLTGHIVDSGRLDKEHNLIYTSAFRSGIYLLALQSRGGERITRKIFVN